MLDGTTSVIGPTASHGVHLELDLALGDLLGSRIRTLIRTGETARQAAPAELRDALRTIVADRTVRPRVWQLAVDLAGRIEHAMRRHRAANQITMTLERADAPAPARQPPPPASQASPALAPDLAGWTS